jgi:hypothetical protein
VVKSQAGERCASGLGRDITEAALASGGRCVATPAIVAASKTWLRSIPIVFVQLPMMSQMNRQLKQPCMWRWTRS